MPDINTLSNVTNTGINIAILDHVVENTELTRKSLNMSVKALDHWEKAETYKLLELQLLQQILAQLKILSKGEEQ